LAAGEDWADSDKLQQRWVQIVALSPGEHSARDEALVEDGRLYCFEVRDQTKRGKNRDEMCFFKLAWKLGAHFNIAFPLHILGQP